MNKIDSERYPNVSMADRNRFHREQIVPLIKASLIETAKREIKIDGKVIKARFYYPCVSSVQISKILYEGGAGELGTKVAKVYELAGISSVEAAVGISQKDLENEGKALIAFFLPIFLQYILNLQDEIKKSPKTHKYLEKI